MEFGTYLYLSDQDHEKVVNAEDGIYEDVDFFRYPETGDGYWYILESDYEAYDDLLASDIFDEIDLGFFDYISSTQNFGGF